jgi:CheY-like chemotaxis protein
MSTSSTPGAAYRVLAIDDNHGDLLLLEEAIAAVGAPVTLVRCGSAAEALDILSITQKFDLILSDLNMPGISGLELFQRLHGTPEFKALPLVLMSSSRKEKLPRGIADAMMQVPYFTKADTWDGFLRLAREISAMLVDGRSSASARRLAERMTPPSGYSKFSEAARESAQNSGTVP